MMHMLVTQLDRANGVEGRFEFGKLLHLGLDDALPGSQVVLLSQDKVLSLRVLDSLRIVRNECKSFILF